MGHVSRARAFVADVERTGPGTTVRSGSCARSATAAAATVPEWEALRDLASAIKTHTLSRLDEYLALFERRATARGITVHWARDAAEHNEIVARDPGGARGIGAWSRASPC
jgi:L-lactate dehydrogenase complex protein LldF